MRVLTWNLYHGRAVPAGGRDLEAEFAAALAGWDWDVALLQEVPPWWPPVLARACGAQQRTALTSRNGLLPVRRFLARRTPDLIKSHGGGANAILTRPAVGTIAAHRSVVLRRRPERRVCHAVELSGGAWVANLHAQVHSEQQAQADIARAAAATLSWAGDAPALLGGDLNVRAPVVPRFDYLGGHGVDHILGRGFTAVGAPELPARGPLSDHAPVIVCVEAQAGMTLPLGFAPPRPSGEPCSDVPPSR